MLCFFAEVIKMNPLLATAANPVIEQEVQSGCGAAVFRAVGERSVMT